MTTVHTHTTQAYSKDETFMLGCKPKSSNHPKTSYTCRQQLHHLSSILQMLTYKIMCFISPSKAVCKHNYGKKLNYAVIS